MSAKKNQGSRERFIQVAAIALIIVLSMKARQSSLWTQNEVIDSLKN